MSARPDPTPTERRLRRALEPASVARPSPDLFERVVDAVEGDRVRRRSLRLTAAGAAVLVALVAAAVVAFTPRQDGRLVLPWWVLETATTVVLVALALWLGPFIKRFGRAYAADVFHDNPQTGKSYILLTDVVYYLIFTAYILATVHVDQRAWSGYTGTVTAGQIGTELTRVAGVLVIIGVLHGVNIVLMPVLGRLFSLNRRVASRDRGARDDD